MSAEFTPFPKMARFYRDIVITEKIDGTNAAINFTQRNFLGQSYENPSSFIGDDFAMTVQSRSRIISTKDDNFGFARWCNDNAQGLFEALGWGIHFGEWWGSGIQRGYGLPKGEKRFSLFNTSRWMDIASDVPGLSVVPVLYEGPFSFTKEDSDRAGTWLNTHQAPTWAMNQLRQQGSFASKRSELT